LLSKLGDASTAPVNAKGIRGLFVTIPILEQKRGNSSNIVLHLECVAHGDLDIDRLIRSRMRLPSLPLDFLLLSFINKSAAEKKTYRRGKYDSFNNY
jgi:hypothetical protein